jgi:hypothetical protein
MAHEKLSPRQRMIGMMYLVLTAMLALNVSKEAVEAFKKVDQGLTLTVKNYELKNNLIYSEFDRAAAENPTKAGRFKTAAYAVKERADEIFNYIQDLKIEIIRTAENDPETPAVKGREVIIEEVTRHIDDTNVPSQILIGANENGKAYALKAMINDYRNALIETLVAVICILSEMQLNIRNAETEVLNYLYSQIDASSFKFNRLNAIVIPTSNYVTLGSTYEAKVFISATDSTQQPQITVGDQVLPLDDTGKGIYIAKATSTGVKKWGGIISLKAPDGSIKSYRFNEEYSVGEPNVVVSPTAMNVMYKGLDNPIDISVPGVGPDKIKIRVNHGTFSQKRVKNSKGEYFRGNWAVSPEQVGKIVQVIVTADMNGKPTTFAPIEFRVKKLPDPVARFGNKSSGSITKADALAQTGVFATLGEDFDFELIYTVTGFTVSYSDRLGDRQKDSNNWKLTAEQKDIISSTTRGKDLTIKNIKALGPDGITRELGAIVLRID